MTAQAVADPMDAIVERLMGSMMRTAQKQYGGQQYGFKHNAGGAPISVGYSHGPGGNLSFPGVDQDVFYAGVGASGILAELPTRPSVLGNPLFEVITGVGADTGTEKDAVCDDAEVAGLLTSGIITSVFGRYERMTPELEINRLGLYNDRADPTDLRLVGSPIAESGGLLGGHNPATPGDVLTNEISRKFFELNTSLYNLISRQLWIGNPQNNSAAGGYKEVTGFQKLINTGYTDAVTNGALPAVDSDVKNFNYVNVTDDGDGIVNALTYIYFTRRDRAYRANMLPVRWVFAMRPEMFRELTKVWPCAYFTYQCAVARDGTNVNLNLDARAQTEMRDDMWNNRYLLIDGERIEVVLDDGIPSETQTTNGSVPAAAFSSSIFLIPMSILGGRAVTYLEYMDYQNPSIQSAIDTGLVLARVDGPWLLTPKQTNWCIQWQVKIEPRLVMRTPWLAGRLDHVVASPLQRTASPFPGDAYAINGGETSRSGPSYHTLWS